LTEKAENYLIKVNVCEQKIPKRWRSKSDLEGTAVMGGRRGTCDLSVKRSFAV
jgi:hypothetical protein